MAAYRVHAHGSWARALAHAGHVLGRSPQASGAAGGRLPQLIVAVRKAALVAAVALPRLHELLAQLGLVHGHVRRLQQHPCQPQTFGNTTTDTAWKKHIRIPIQLLPLHVFRFQTPSPLASSAMPERVNNSGVVQSIEYRVDSSSHLEEVLCGLQRALALVLVLVQGHPAASGRQ